MAAVVARFAAPINEEVAECYLANDTSAFGGRFDPRSFGGPAVLDEHLGGRGSVAVLREVFGYDKTPPENLPPIGSGAQDCFLLRWVSERPADLPASGDTPGGLPAWKPYRPTPFGASAMIWRLAADGQTVPMGTYSDGVWLRTGASAPELPVGGVRAALPPNGRFAGFEGATHRAFLDVESRLMVWLYPMAGGPGRRVSPQKLDHWTDVWTRFTWRDRVFLALRVEDGHVEGQLCDGSLSFARANGLEILSPDHVYGRFSLAEVSELREVRTDLLGEWSSRNLSATPGPGAGTEFGRRLRDALVPESGAPDVNALVAAWPGGSGPRMVLDHVLGALVGSAFSEPDDRGVLAFSRELAARHPIGPNHVAMTVSRALGETGAPAPDLPSSEQLRISLAICAKIGVFRGREHVDWLIRQGEGAASRAGQVVG